MLSGLVFDVLRLRCVCEVARFIPARCALGEKAVAKTLLEASFFLTAFGVVGDGSTVGSFSISIIASFVSG